MPASYRYEDPLSEHLARELACEPKDPEPRLPAAMPQWGAAGVPRFMDDAAARSEEALLRSAKRTLDLISEVRGSLAR